jgi:hypothetical protein
MEENNDTLGMGLFDNASNFEINLEADPADYDDDDSAEDNDGLSDDDDLNIDNLNEDEGSEEVIEEGDTEEGEEIDEDSSPNIYSSFASVLSEQGLLPSLDLLGDTKIENVDDLSTAFKSEITNQVKQYLLDKIGEQGYDALEKGITLSEYQQHQDNIGTLEGIDDEALTGDVELSKKIIYQDYIAQGIDETRAMRLLKKSIDAGDETLLEDAKEALESLKIVEGKRLEKLSVERQASQQANDAAQEKIDNDLKNSIYNTSEIIKGVKLNKTIQDKIYSSITKVVGKNENGIMENQLMKDRRTNPVDFDTKLYYLYEITKGFSDFSKIVSKSESTAISKLEKQLRSNKFEGSGSPSFLSDPDSYGGIGSEIVI